MAVINVRSAPSGYVRAVVAATSWGTSSASTSADGTTPRSTSVASGALSVPSTARRIDVGSSAPTGRSDSLASRAVTSATSGPMSSAPVSCERSASLRPTSRATA